MRAIIDTSVLVANADARPELAGVEGRVSSFSYGEMNFGIAVAPTDRDRTARLTSMQRFIAACSRVRGAFR